VEKRFLFLFAAAMVTMICIVTPTNSSAEVNVSINIPLPGLAISAPPDMAVVPGTYVYYPPEVSADIFFYHGYWYRPYRDGWFIGNGYNGPWRSVPIGRVPRSVIAVPHGYRSEHPRYERIAHDDMRRNWRGWERERHWDHGEHRGWDHSEHGGRDRGDGGRDNHRRHGDGDWADRGDHGHGDR
jgi:hypothetical protein